VTHLENKISVLVMVVILTDVSSSKNILN